MTALIKRDAPTTGRIERLNLHAPSLEPMALTKDPLAAALEAEVDRLGQLISNREAEHALAIGTARAEGKLEAERAYAHDDALALTALQEALAAGLISFESRLNSLDKLALTLCETALSKVFADPGDFHELIARSIALQIRSLRRETVVRIVVSAEDYGSDDAFEKLEQAFDMGVEINRDPLVARGACRIDLRLGHIELDVAKYWDAIQQRLRELAGADGAP